MKNNIKIALITICLFALSFALFSCGGKNPPELKGITFDSAEFTYDGNEKSIAISGTLPEDVSVKYSGNGVTEVGVYTVVAKFYFNDEYMEGKDLTATLTIKEPAVTPPEEPETPVDPPVGDNIDLSYIVFDNASYVYDGSTKSINIKE